jgi:hypothetical protein
MFRLTIRLVVLALAAFGAKTLYDKYAPKATALQEPSLEFLDRAKGVVTDTAQQVTGAASDMGDELKRAASDATDEAARRLDDGADSDADAAGTTGTAAKSASNSS